MLTCRKPTIEDAQLYFDWTNDPEVRKQSFSSTEIDFSTHKRWFSLKLNAENCCMLVFQNVENQDVGQVRIEETIENEAIIGISITAEYRGKGYAKEMLRVASDLFLADNASYTINAYIKEENLSSKNAFESAGFVFKEFTTYKNFNSFHYIKK